MLTVAEAEAIILAHVAPFLSEDCPLSEAQGRILRQDLRADRDLPPFNRIMLDGYALRRASLAAGIRRFRIAGVLAAGMVPVALNGADDDCIEVMTGASLPKGADCVVPYEETERAAGASHVTVATTGGELATGHGWHRRGSDYSAGTTVVRSGTRLTGREIAVAAACSYTNMTVASRPRIAVVVTGDELVEVVATVAPHQLRRSNDYALRAALLAQGYNRTERFHLRDLPTEMESTLRHILLDFDVVLLTGGVSKGKFDHLPTVLKTLGVNRLFHGVAQRPGKPMWFGLSPRSTPIFALPGNPVSAYTCLHRYVLPALAAASGLRQRSPWRATLTEPVNFPAPLAYFLPVKVRSDPQGRLLATPAPTNTSGDFGSLVATDGFLELPPESASFPAGTSALYYPWS